MYVNLRYRGYGPTAREQTVTIDDANYRKQLSSLLAAVRSRCSNIIFERPERRFEFDAML